MPKKSDLTFRFHPFHGFLSDLEVFVILGRKWLMGQVPGNMSRNVARSEDFRIISRLTCRTFRAEASVSCSFRKLLRMASGMSLIPSATFVVIKRSILGNRLS